ncbi:hypothetical protein ACWEQD_12205 [Rhodococcus pyridinivorans]
MSITEDDPHAVTLENEQSFVEHLNALGVPLFVATKGVGEREFYRPMGWTQLEAADNRVRLCRHRIGDALCGVLGESLAVVDVDTKNGGCIEQVRQLLAELGVTIFAEVTTPSGGKHFYVAAHPDLATVHASGERDGLVGYPGVEILAAGTNVFLPGTRRPKYNGDGYAIELDDLEALADGGDPDGAVALAGWVAAHRVSKPETFTPAPPWNGTPPDTRQQAYLDAVLSNMAQRIGAMEPNSGRNTALFNAALACGNYIAGAGLDERCAIDTLMRAAAACGVLDEDGEARCLASIRSGISNGRRRPRAVPEPKGRNMSEGNANPPPAPMNLEQVHDTFHRWLGDDYDLDAINAVLAAAAVERLDGDPLWLLLISGSGNAKTETVQVLAGVGALITSTVSSVGALLSATSRKDRSEDATGGLLRKIGDRGVLVIKDVTSILSMNKDARAEVLAALREVYDGRWSRNVGTDGGRTLDWTGRIVVVGAVTTAWDKAHAAIASMGDRFVLLRMDSTTGRQRAGRRAIANTGREEQMRAELAAAAAGVLASVAYGDAPQLSEEETDALLAAADLVTQARTSVDFDYRGNVVDAHAPEMPTRFAKQLAQVVRGGVAIGMNRVDALQLAIRCARDSMPPLRLAIVDDLAMHPESSTTEVRKRLGKPRSTVDRQLQALHMLEVLECEEENTSNGSGTVWRYSLADGIDPHTLDPKQYQKS